MVQFSRIETVLILNRYGTALLAGSPAFGWAVWLVARNCGASENTARWAAMALALSAAVWGVRVTLRVAARRRLAIKLIEEIESNGYDPQIFEHACRELCLRQVTRLVLQRVGRAHEYRSVLKRFQGNREPLIVHSNPAVKQLLRSGAIDQRMVQEAVAAASRSSLR